MGHRDPLHCLGRCGCILGSYLKKKGENLATHEDIDKLGRSGTGGHEGDQGDRNQDFE